MLLYYLYIVCYIIILLYYCIHILLYCYIICVLFFSLMQSKNVAKFLNTSFISLYTPPVATSASVIVPC